MLGLLHTLFTHCAMPLPETNSSSSFGEVDCRFHCFATSTRTMTATADAIAAVTCPTACTCLPSCTVYYRWLRLFHVSCAARLLTTISATTTATAARPSSSACETARFSAWGPRIHCWHLCFFQGEKRSQPFSS